MQNKSNNNNKKNRKGKKTKGLGRSKTVPVAYTTQIVTKSPVFSGGLDRTVIKHREFIHDLLGPNLFEVESDGINPGNPDLFPWLSNVAVSYETYHFRKLAFYYEPIAPTIQAGTVMMAIDYDCNDITPYSKSDFLSQYGSCRSSPWSSFSIPVDLNRLSYKQYFVRGHVWPSDRKLYDIGSFMYATEAISSTTTDVTVGELWVDYEVELIHPQVSQINFPAIFVSSDTVGIDSLHPWGTTPVRKGELGVSIPDPAVYSIKIHKAGDYVLTYGVRGALVKNPVLSFVLDGVTVGSTSLSSWSAPTGAGAYTTLTCAIRATKPLATFGIDTDDCAAVWQGGWMILVPANYNTINRVDPQPT